MNPETRAALIELGCTVALPLVILQVGLSWFGPVGTVVVAAVPPAGFLVWQMVRTRTVGALGVIGLAGVTLSGGIGLLKLDPVWFAWKEAAIPVVMAVAIAFTAPTPWSPVGAVLEKVLDPGALAKLREDPDRAARLAAAVRRSTFELAVATALPGFVAFALARAVVVSPTGTEAWGLEVRDYSAWALPTVTGPAVVLVVYWARRLFAALEAAAGAPLESLLPSAAE